MTHKANRILFDPLAKKQFLDDIKDMVLRDKCTYIDAILEWCELHGVDPELAASAIDKPMKEKLEVEGINLRILPKKIGLDV